jgi:hypothetical protein
MYDSLNEGAQLPNTMFFKVMTILGTFIKGNSSEDQVVWIEETRSMPVTAPEKS